MKKQEYVLNLDDKTVRSLNFLYHFVWPSLLWVHETSPRRHKITKPPLSWPDGFISYEYHNIIFEVKHVNFIFFLSKIS